MFEFNLDYTQYGKKLYRYKKDLQSVAAAVYQELKLDGPIYFDCTFVDLDEIHVINREKRNVDRPTDVISFAFWDGGIKTPLLGELYICYEKVKMQAEEYGHSFRRELCFLFLHGLLHMLGYDHMEKADEEIMFGLQNKILDQLHINR
ncbi:rRNA maturation RNase YbeY [Ureaplasma ceti]|uniref:Endoribonuclease YbeY n=1 Tax=Ureaplasma ceti TaxID=3119530 RepID=A0ABP9U8E3_9BACT